MKTGLLSTKSKKQINAYLGEIRMKGRLCKNKIPTHQEAAGILKQIQKYPEVCDFCKIKPCTYGLYAFGDIKPEKTQESENCQQ